MCLRDTQPWHKSQTRWLELGTNGRLLVTEWREYVGPEERGLVTLSDGRAFDVTSFIGRFMPAAWAVR